MGSKVLQKGGVIFFWLIVWQLIAVVVDNPILFVTPFQMLNALVHLLGLSQTYISIVLTIYHVFIGFLIAFISGAVFAYLSYRIKFIKEVIYPLMIVLKAIPVASFIVLVLVWSDSKYLATIVASIVGTPLVYTIIYEGLTTIDVKLEQLALVYNVSWIKRVCHIEIKGIAPFILSAIQISIGYCFKSAIAAEVIGLPLHSLGAGLYQAKVYFATDELFAYTTLIIGLSYLLEKAMVALVRLLYQKGGYYD